MSTLGTNAAKTSAAETNTAETNAAETNAAETNAAETNAAETNTPAERTPAASMRPGLTRGTPRKPPRLFSTVITLMRKELLVELRTLRVSARDGFVRRLHLRRVPLRAESDGAAWGPRGWGAVGNASVRRDAWREQAVRRRLRAGRLRWLPARPSRPLRDVDREGELAASLPRRARRSSLCPRSRCCCSALQSGLACHRCCSPSCSPILASP